MLKMYRYFLILFVACSSLTSQAQDSTGVQSKPKKWQLTGYLKNMQSAQIANADTNWNFINLIHNREDLRFYPNKHWDFHIGMRNRIYYGESVQYLTQAPALFKSSNSYFDLQKIVAQGPSYIIHTTLDRASATYTKEKWEVTAGRQRINWGQNFVWNPNDIFNAYSYFNFDYEERPGVDAVRLKYYPGTTSTAEIAYKPGRVADSSIIAGLYRFASGGYDYQFLAGYVNGDYVAGAGWSGVIKRAGFTGEITGFFPTQNIGLRTTVVSASMGINYTFPNSLYLHTAYLYSSTGMIKISNTQRDILFSQVVSAKRLSPARHSVFAETAYQFNPLLRGNFSGIVDPSDGSFFLGPFINYSVSNSVEFLFGGQLFFGDSTSLYGGYGKFVFARLKWSF
ncbi:MAG: hypothetical protein KDC07_08605 [Chitinophagaceae bacterium]|nr:hypothetical protein [Chitinophagaceae bacterium]